MIQVRTIPPEDWPIINGLPAPLEAYCFECGWSSPPTRWASQALEDKVGHSCEVIYA